MKLIGEFKFTPFEKGWCLGRGYYLQSLTSLPALDETVAWFLDNYANARTGQTSH